MIDEASFSACASDTVAWKLRRGTVTVKWPYWSIPSGTPEMRAAEVACVVNLLEGDDTSPALSVLLHETTATRIQEVIPKRIKLCMVDVP